MARKRLELYLPDQIREWMGVIAPDQAEHF
jgi:hypothetical protein